MWLLERLHLSETNEIDNTLPIYGMVVTYRNYLIGDGKVFWDNIIGDIVKEKISKLGITNLILPENLFFVSIDEFDYLIAGAKEKNLSISMILSTVARRNRVDSTRCLMLKQHLQSMWEHYYPPKYVQDKVHQNFKNLEKRFMK